MATSVHPKRSSKMRSNSLKTKEEIISVVSAKYVKDFLIAIKFNTGEERVIDFLPLFHSYVKGSNLKYFSIRNFKKFIVRNGNVFWGQDEDIIFSIDKLYVKPASESDDEVLFVM